MLEPNQPRPKRGPGPSNEVPALDLLTEVGGRGGGGVRRRWKRSSLIAFRLCFS